MRTTKRLGRFSGNVFGSRAGVGWCGLAFVAACSGGEIDGPLATMPQGGQAGSGASVPPAGGGAAPSTDDGQPPAGGGGQQQPAGPSELVLDDFEDGDGTVSAGGITGTWGTYSDGTSAITPPVASPVVPVDGALHVSGAGFSEWGAGLGLDLEQGGQGYANLSSYASVKVRARGTGVITVELATPATTGSDEGGECTGEGCFGHYFSNITLTPEYQDHVVTFSTMGQPSWGQSAARQTDRVMGLNFLARAEGGQSASIDLWVDSVALVPPAAPAATGGGQTGAGAAPPLADGANPFAGRTLHSEGGSLGDAFSAAQGADRDLLAKIVDKPAAFWLVGGDPTRAGAIAAGAGGNYPVMVAYNIPGRDCGNESAGGLGSGAEYRAWIDGMASSLAGREGAIILEPDALALGCNDEVPALLSYAVSKLRENPAIAVYLDAGHSNWIGAGDMAGRLRAANIEAATGFALNVSNFETTQSLIAYGRDVSSQVGNKPFVIDTSRNGQGGRGGEWCNPAGAGLGEAPTANTGDPLVHAFLWVKRPGESDGACGQCTGVPAGQFCVGYALELARNAIF